MINPNMIKWRCRRGVQELDILLHRFYDQKYLTLSIEEQQNFKALLDLQDPILINWLVKRQQPDAEFKDLVKEILSL
ncbi:MAG: hypothetical protein CMF42_00655 [Legionellales bacterium]|nr:hypothetical protein [Legionellales bacterium]OUX68270.1 MAG: hypothetical protein CBD38_00200 [bacterium TMED178]|tara:strand:- start:2126 stop:2356 length:231 start_codon:yes stop_codon:yes gene_type:complete